MSLIFNIKKNQELRQTGHYTPVWSHLHGMVLVREIWENNSFKTQTVGDIRASADPQVQCTILVKGLIDVVKQRKMKGRKDKVSNWRLLFLLAKM